MIRVSRSLWQNKNRLWHMERRSTPCQEWLLGHPICSFWHINVSNFASREGISSPKKMSICHLMRGTLWAGQWGHRGVWRETRVDYFPRWNFFQWKVTWDLTMKKKSKFYKNYMNRKIIQIYTVETLQLFTLCLWTMLQHVKVGHIALSQMVISFFGLKTPHLWCI